MPNKVLSLANRTSTGFFIVLIVVISRLIGLLEPLELFYFDLLLKARPSEPQDNRIVLIEIDSVNQVSEESSKISAQRLTELITTIQTHEPAVIGFNILADLIDDTDPSFKELSTFISQHESVVTAESFLPPFIYPLPNTDIDSVGFVDVFSDIDKFRRMPLGSPDFQDETQFKFSFSLLLAKFYLEKHGYVLENGKNDPAAMQFGDIEIPKLYPKTGGYHHIDTVDGVQTMVNYRQSHQPFRTTSIQNFETQKREHLDLKDKIVIIGVTDSTKRFRINTPINPEMHGLDLTAHFTSQIVSAVMDNRPLITTSKEISEYVLIVLLSIPIIWTWNKKIPLKRLLIFEVSELFALLAGSYFLLAIYGYWLISVPTILILALNFLVYLLHIYQDDIRRKLLERTFAIIHNGPLQSLSIILNDIRNNQVDHYKLEVRLQELSQDIREIGDTLRGESLSHEQSLLLNGSTEEILDLDNDLHELFHQIYTATLKRDFHNFNDIKTKIRSFDVVPIKKRDFSLKRELCRYLEEAICNVGKHSVEPTQLIVIGKAHEGFYTLTVKDNGFIEPNKSMIPGQGTKIALRLAKKLKGTFNLELLPQKGTICQLRWRP